VGASRRADGLRRTRRAEAEAAAALLGVAPLFLERLDGALAADLDAAAHVEVAMEGLAPDLVITHAPNDYHPTIAPSRRWCATRRDSGCRWSSPTP